MKCTELSHDELEITFFGQGKHQQTKAIAMCSGCPMMRKCTEIAEEMTEYSDGKIVGGAWGVFGGKAYRGGKVVR